METPDSITASAVSARDEVGRAIAAKIRDVRTADELATVTEEVLPEIEKFLESPEEKRLRRMRTGLTLSSIGLGTALGVAFITAFIPMKDFEFLFMISLVGIVTFFLGLGFLLNGVLLTVPKRGLPHRMSESERAAKFEVGKGQTNDLILPEAQGFSSSVTEHTTQHLKEKEPVQRD